MNKKLLKQILSVPTCSYHEGRMVDFIIKWAKKKKIEYMVDGYGNVFLRKGSIKEGEAYPCVVAHMDTVHRTQADLVDTTENLIIVETTNTEGSILYARRKLPSGVEINTGVGGDDKAGIFIALELIQECETIMGAFFVEEEVGCNGSRTAKNNEWLNQAGYFIQFDAPTDDWISKVCSGVQLFGDEFQSILQPVWDEYDMSEPNMYDPFTDVKELKLNYPVACINYFAGYMEMHTPFEYVVLPYVEKAIGIGFHSILALGNKRYEFSSKK